MPKTCTPSSSSSSCCWKPREKIEWLRVEHENVLIRGIKSNFRLGRRNQNHWKTMPNSFGARKHASGVDILRLSDILMAWEMSGHEGRPSPTLMSSDNVSTQSNGAVSVWLFMCVYVCVARLIWRVNLPPFLYLFRISSSSDEVKCAENLYVSPRNVVFLSRDDDHQIINAHPFYLMIAFIDPITPPWI